MVTNISYVGSACIQQSEMYRISVDDLSYKVWQAKNDVERGALIEMVLSIAQNIKFDVMPFHDSWEAENFFDALNGAIVKCGDDMLKYKLIAELAKIVKSVRFDLLPFKTLGVANNFFETLNSAIKYAGDDGVKQSLVVALIEMDRAVTFDEGIFKSGYVAKNFFNMLGDIIFNASDIDKDKVVKSFKRKFFAIQKRVNLFDANYLLEAVLNTLKIAINISCGDVQKELMADFKAIEKRLEGKQDLSLYIISLCKEINDII